MLATGKYYFGMARDAVTRGAGSGFQPGDGNGDGEGDDYRDNYCENDEEQHLSYVFRPFTPQYVLRFMGQDLEILCGLVLL